MGCLGHCFKSKPCLRRPLLKICNLHQIDQSKLQTCSVVNHMSQLRTYTPIYLRTFIVHNICEVLWKSLRIYRQVDWITTIATHLASGIMYYGHHRYTQMLRDRVDKDDASDTYSLVCSSSVCCQQLRTFVNIGKKNTFWQQFGNI